MRMRDLSALYRLLPTTRRRQLLWTLLLMLLGAAGEVLTIGAVLPFLAFASDPESAAVPAGLTAWLEAIGGSALAGATLLLIVAVMLAAAVRLLLVWTSQKLAMLAGADLAAAIFSRNLRLPYAEQLRRNSSRTLANVDQVQRVVTGVLLPAMQGIIAVVITVFVTGALFLIDPFATFVGLVAATAIYVSVSLVTRPALRRNSDALARTAIQRTRATQESLGGIRDIILDRSQDAVEAHFRAIDFRFRRAQAVNAFLASGARFPIEAAGVTALALVTLAMSLKPGGLVAAIPVLGALALGAQRLLPLLQTAYSGWSQATGNFRIFSDVMAEVDGPVCPQPAPSARGALGQFEALEFERVGYRHVGEGFALSDISLRICRGEHVGIAGVTGTGKSTLLDLMMGLLEPQEGEIRVNRRLLEGEVLAAWQDALAHVPQSVFLVDDSIAANIAFPRGPGELDGKDLDEAIRMSALGPLLASLPQGLETMVGERGVRLSGGQRQRIGLARALVRKPAVLMLDEATSALDEATEREVLTALRAIEGLTLLTVAHRRSTLSGCDRVITMRGGTIAAEVPPTIAR